jgi:hypothetical protein
LRPWISNSGRRSPREAERELDAATTRMALDAAKKLMRAKAELKRLQAEVSA